MKWWELIEDWGDSTCVVRRFSTEDACNAYIETMEVHGDGQYIDPDCPYVMDTDDPNFFNDGLEKELYECCN